MNIPGPFEYSSQELISPTNLEGQVCIVPQSSSDQICYPRAKLNLVNNILATPRSFASRFECDCKKLLKAWTEINTPIRAAESRDGMRIESSQRAILAALKNEVLRADEGEMRCEWSSAGIQGRGKRENHEKKKHPTSSGIIRHDSHLRKSGSDPAGD
ncbi:hypothetical protein PR048_007823 [Dryococelus australis]|uniref:Uncharacterized protein n=1 Tax=Dryococelus australis TaxID=614101 RepID=A0ABQ9HW70_9NEOP|nr:hypothetical protein PR048_007823 [Dryococelus australis]